MLTFLLKSITSLSAGLILIHHPTQWHKVFHYFDLFTAPSFLASSVQVLLVGSLPVTEWAVSTHLPLHLPLERPLEQAARSSRMGD